MADNLVDAMRKHLQAGNEPQSGGHVANIIADSFTTHFKYLKNMNNAQAMFPVVLHYDCCLRGLFIRESHTFHMDTFQNDIWHECLSDLHTSQVEMLNIHLAEMETFLAQAKLSGPLKYKDQRGGLSVPCQSPHRCCLEDSSELQRQVWGSEGKTGKL